MKEVNLLGAWSSVYCHRVIWALKLKGVEYDYKEEDLQNKSNELLLYNPVYQRVPVLVHNGKALVESIIILEFIDELWPENPLLPPGPSEKAEARFWAKYLEDKSSIFYSYFRATGEEQERLAREAKDVLKMLEEKGLRQKKFFGGDIIGFADLCLGWIACWLEQMQEAAGVTLIEPDNLPHLYAWSQRFMEVREIKDSLPDKSKMQAYFNGLREKFTASTAS